MGSRLHSNLRPAKSTCSNTATTKENPMTATLTNSNPTQATSSPLHTFRETKVLVVDDHPAVQLGIRRLIEDEPDFVLVAVTSTAESAMSIAERDPVDVVVADYHLRSRNGLWLCRQLKRLPDPPRVVMYSAYADGVLAAACVVAGADGLVSKGGVGADLCDAIRGVSRGQRLLPRIPQPLAGMLGDRLEPAEQAVFAMLLAGIAPEQVAHTLSISRSELDSTMSSMLRTIEDPRPQSTTMTSAAGPPPAGSLHGVVSVE
jgi:DNA-binding NarL/FixJ family response regulator